MLKHYDIILKLIMYGDKHLNILRSKMESYDTPYHTPQMYVTHTHTHIYICIYVYVLGDHITLHIIYIYVYICIYIYNVQRYVISKNWTFKY